jgi:hypothetical protein
VVVAAAVAAPAAAVLAAAPAAVATDASPQVALGVKACAENVSCGEQERLAACGARQVL